MSCRRRTTRQQWTVCQSRESDAWVVSIAWDPTNRGASAADDLDLSNIALYSWVGPLFTPAQVTRIRTKSPIAIPAAGCPLTLDGGTDHSYAIKFGTKSGGTGASLVVDCWLEVFEGVTRVYEIAPSSSPMRVDLAIGSATNVSEVSMQDRVTYEAMEDPPGADFWTTVFLGGGVDSKEIWRTLITPNAPFSWL